MSGDDPPPRSRRAARARRPSAPDPAALGVTVARLIGFGTRHTLSITTDPARGIGAARRRVAVPEAAGFRVRWRRADGAA